MGRHWSSAAAAVLLTTAGLVVSAPVGNAAPACGVDLAAPEISAAAANVPPYPGTDWQWTAQPSSVEGNFDRCATLSTALVTVEGATGSSPITALMFHRGQYLGTATSVARGFTTLNAARTTDDTVVLDYKVAGACNACAPAAVHPVRFHWTGDHVEMLDPAPPP